MRKNHGYETDPKTKKLPDGTILIGPYSEGPFTYTDRFRNFTDPDGSEIFHGFELMEENGVSLWRRDYGGTGDSRFYKFLKENLYYFTKTFLSLCKRISKCRKIKCGRIRDDFFAFFEENDR